MFSMIGQITFDPECIGKEMPAVVLVGKLSWHDTPPEVQFALLMDYHFRYEKWPDHPEKIWAVTRPVIDREKYPNWPKPESTD